jgi:glyoxylase-like metal-dependent hydrolase (beta-lactamase superfamily II)
MTDPSRDRLRWAEPGVHDLGDGVHRVALPIPDEGLHAVNVYIVEDAAGPYLIDSGQAMAGAREPLETALRTIGIGLHEVAGFLLTHIHRDHYTQAIELRREFGTPVHASVGERESLDRIRDPAQDRYGAQLDLLRISGAGALADANTGLSDGLDPDIWEHPDHWLSDGDVIALTSRRLRVEATPGHTGGHIVLVDDDRSMVFAGDHVLPHITPSLGFEPVVPERPLADYLASLGRGLAGADAMVLPAHGPLIDSLHRRAAELVAHHDVRLDSSLTHLGSKPLSPAQVAAELSWTRRERRFVELGPIDQMLAILETKAHLDVLADAGAAVRSVDEDGSLSFSV